MGELCAGGYNAVDDKDGRRIPFVLSIRIDIDGVGVI